MIVDTSRTERGAGIPGSRTWLISVASDVAVVVRVPVQVGWAIRGPVLAPATCGPTDVRERAIWPVAAAAPAGAVVVPAGLLERVVDRPVAEVAGHPPVVKEDEELLTDQRVDGCVMPLIARERLDLPVAA